MSDKQSTDKQHEAFAADLPDGPERWIKEFYALAASSILVYGEPTPYRLQRLDQARDLENKLLAHIRSAPSATPASDKRGEECAERMEWLADKIPAYGDYAKEAAIYLMQYAHELRARSLPSAIAPSAETCRKDGCYALRPVQCAPAKPQRAMRVVPANPTREEEWAFFRAYNERLGWAAALDAMDATDSSMSTTR